jgi:hypothetical protein
VECGGIMQAGRRVRQGIGLELEFEMIMIAGRDG